MNKDTTSPNEVKSAFHGIRFIDFGKIYYHHFDKDMAKLKNAWNHFQQNPIGFVTANPRGNSLLALMP